MSGWSVLASQYRANDDIEEEKYRFVSGSMGKGLLPVKFGNCLFITVGNAGIYISILALFRFRCPPLFIPWSQIETIKEERLLGIFPSVTILVKGSCPQISLRGKVQQAIVNAVNKHSRNANDQRTNWRGK